MLPGFSYMWFAHYRVSGVMLGKPAYGFEHHSLVPVMFLSVVQVCEWPSPAQGTDVSTPHPPAAWAARQC